MTPTCTIWPSTVLRVSDDERYNPDQFSSNTESSTTYMSTAKLESRCAAVSFALTELLGRICATASKPFARAVRSHMDEALQVLISMRLRVDSLSTDAHKEENVFRLTTIEVALGILNSCSVSVQKLNGLFDMADKQSLLQRRSTTDDWFNKFQAGVRQTSSRIEGMNICLEVVLLLGNLTVLTKAVTNLVKRYHNDASGPTLGCSSLLSSTSVKTELVVLDYLYGGLVPTVDQAITSIALDLRQMRKAILALRQEDRLKDEPLKVVMEALKCVQSSVQPIEAQVMLAMQSHRAFREEKPKTLRDYLNPPTIIQEVSRVTDSLIEPENRAYAW